MLFYIDLKSYNTSDMPERPTLHPIVDTFKAQYSIVDVDDDKWLIYTDEDAPNGKMVEVVLKNGTGVQSVRFESF